MAQIKAGIIGGAGYTGGELLRILLRHPHAEIGFVHSKSNAGKPVHAVHGDLLGETDLMFTDMLHDNVDVLFLCVGHGEAGVFLAENKIPERVKIIDVSQDFRLQTRNLKPETQNFVYGLPELNRDAISKASCIANPGCFATGVQLGLLPLAKAGLLKNDVHVSAITGSTGAGQKPGATSHFSWREGNMSVYKAFTHQHLAEITQSLKQLQADGVPEIHFIPYRGNFTRGIIASLYTKTDLSAAAAHDLYTNYYETHPFVHITGENPHLKQVVNTNNCILHTEKHGENLLIVSVIDNLTKGASGQAVQNMNLMFGLGETAGLKLKATAF